jgi:hypothetical protein
VARVGRILKGKETEVTKKLRRIAIKSDLTSAGFGDLLSQAGCPEEQVGQLTRQLSTWLDQPTPKPEDEEILRKIREIVVRLASEDQVSLFRELVRLAAGYELGAPAFRNLLLQAGLAPSRASELSRVRGCHDACQHFTRKDSPCSLREALMEARAQAANAVRRTTAQLLRGLIRQGSQWGPGQTFDGWTLQIESGGVFHFCKEDLHVRIEGRVWESWQPAGIP